MNSEFSSLDGEQESYSVFADGQWHWNKSTVQLGTRYSYIEQESDQFFDKDSHWTGSLSVQHTFNPRATIYGQLASGFRFPELTEKFFNGSTGRGIVVGSPDLDPETSIGLEIGTEISFRELHGTISAYVTKIDDYIERVTITERLLSFRNVKNGKIHGVEVQFDYAISPNWQMRAGGHWLDGEDDDGNNLQDMTPPLVFLALSRTSDQWLFDLDLRHRFASNRVHEDELPIERFSLVSASISLKINDKSSLKLWGENLLNDDFRLTSDNLSSKSAKRGIGLSFSWYN